MKCCFDKDRECNNECTAYMKVGAKDEIVHCLRLGKSIRSDADAESQA